MRDVYSIEKDRWNSDLSLFESLILLVCYPLSIPREEEMMNKNVCWFILPILNNVQVLEKSAHRLMRTLDRRLLRAKPIRKVDFLSH